MLVHQRVYRTANSKHPTYNPLRKRTISWKFSSCIWDVPTRVASDNPRSSANHRSPRDSCAGAWCSWREGLEKYHCNSLIRVSFRRYSHFDQPRKYIYYHLLFISIICCLFFFSNHSSLLNNPNPDVFLLVYVFLTNMCLKIRHIFIYTHTVNISYLYIIPQIEWHPVSSMSLPYFSPFNIVSFQLAMFFHGQYPTGPGRQSRQSSASLEVFAWSRNL